jgi:hypothetical protein
LKNSSQILKFFSKKKNFYKLYTGSNRTYYIYDAQGSKLRRKLAGTSTTTTDYCDGAEFENNILSRIFTDEGYIEPAVGLPDTIPSKYFYQLKDHFDE